MAKTKTKARTVARRKKPAAKATSTALVRSTRRTPAKVTVLPPAPETNGYIVPADGSLQLGALGLVELKLTKEEERVLSEPVKVIDIEWKPRVKDGPPEIPYLPHHVYTAWFNRAFGRLGWQIVPIGKPVKTDTNAVLLPYILHVHTRPVAFAWGEQDYFANNPQQTYGDVVESTVASALRRCAKRMGVGLEMWNRKFIRTLERPGQERQQQQQGRKRNGNSRPPAPVEHADLDKIITDEQRLKLWNTSRRVGRADAEVQAWLKKRFKVSTSSDISRRDYDRIIEMIEQRGALPEGE